MSAINIVFSVDNNYVTPLCVAAYSIVANTRYNKKDINFYIIIADLTPNNEQLIRGFFNQHHLNLTILKVNINDFINFYTSNHITTSAYYRIIAPQLLKSVNKFIYLDCDLIVEAPIEELYEQALGNNVIGAVTDLGGFHRCEPLGITNGRYFNSGVLLIDAEKWRMQNLTDRLLQFIADNPEKLDLHDQDALNALLSGDWYEVDNKWNKQTLDFSVGNSDYAELMMTKRRAILKEGIAHFTSFGKPWKIYCPHPLRKSFNRYYKEAGFTSLLALEVFEDLHLNKKEKCVLFGTSGLATEFISSFPSIDIAYFLDNNKDKHGKFFHQAPIYLPESVENLKQYKIYVCSSYYNQIKNQLVELGLREDEHFFRI